MNAPTGAERERREPAELYCSRLKYTCEKLRGLRVRMLWDVYNRNPTIKAKAERE
jgi:hypothetical protein